MLQLNRRGGRGLAEAWIPEGELLKGPEPDVNCHAIVEDEEEEEEEEEKKKKKRRRRRKE